MTWLAAIQITWINFVILLYFYYAEKRGKFKTVVLFLVLCLVEGPIKQSQKDSEFFTPLTFAIDTLFEVLSFFIIYRYFKRSPLVVTVVVIAIYIISFGVIIFIK